MYVYALTYPNRPTTIPQNTDGCCVPHLVSLLIITLYNLIPSFRTRLQIQFGCRGYHIYVLNPMAYNILLNNQVSKFNCLTNTMEGTQGQPK